MPYGSGVQNRQLAGVHELLQRAAAASGLSGDAAKRAWHLHGHGALLLVRRRDRLLVQRLQ